MTPKQISSTHLYHYTSKESLLGILSEGFRFGRPIEKMHKADPDAKDIHICMPIGKPGPEDPEVIVCGIYRLNHVGAFSVYCEAVLIESVPVRYGSG